jgi:hypothetical protein
MSDGKRGKRDGGDKGGTSPKRPRGPVGFAKPQKVKTKDQPGESFGINIRGSVVDASKLPTTDNIVGDVWITLNDGHRWCWSGNEWVDITASFIVKGAVNDASELPTAGNAEGDIWFTLDDTHWWRWSGNEWIDRGAYKRVGKRFNQQALNQYLAKVDPSNGAEVLQAVTNCLIIGLLPPPKISTAFFNRMLKFWTRQAESLDAAFDISHKGEQLDTQRRFHTFVIPITARIVQRNKAGQAIDDLMFEDVAKEFELTRWQIKTIYERGLNEMPWIKLMLEHFGISWL